MRCLPFLCCRIDLSPDPVLSPAATSPKWSAPDLSKFQFYLPAEDRYHSWSRCRRGRLPTPRESAARRLDRKSTRLNSSHVEISYAVFCLKKKKKKHG